jgi:hypothetical protein
MVAATVAIATISVYSSLVSDFDQVGQHLHIQLFAIIGASFAAKAPSRMRTARDRSAQEPFA